MSAPPRANAPAIARPIPRARAHPVTSTTFPSNSLTARTSCYSDSIPLSMNGSEPRRPIAITGATLIDGTGRPPLVNATVVIDGDRFSRVGPTTETPAPEGAEVIDAGGHFVIPGLTDMHVH